MCFEKCSQLNRPLSGELIVGIHLRVSLMGECSKVYGPTLWMRLWRLCTSEKRSCLWLNECALETECCC